MIAFASLTLCLLFVVSPLHANPLRIGKRYWPQGSITVPANGTTIEPGASFAYTYNPRGDYCLTAYNTTVWLFTSPPDSLLSNAVTGKFLTRCGYDSVGNQFPPNPCPANLTMPDLSERPGGFGTGKSVSNLPVYLVVVEEWNACEATAGNHLTWTYTQLCYNCTSPQK